MKLNKILHKFNYWTNPYYMIGHDLYKKYPEFFKEHFKFIYKLLDWIVGKKKQYGIYGL